MVYRVLEKYSRKFLERHTGMTIADITSRAISWKKQGYTFITLGKYTWTLEPLLANINSLNKISVTKQELEQIYKLPFGEILRRVNVREKPFRPGKLSLIYIWGISQEMDGSMYIRVKDIVFTWDEFAELVNAMGGTSTREPDDYMRSYQ
jgi:hypothetical protein